jgi:flagellar biosynthesis/type III secretory pathway ATPase
VSVRARLAEQCMSLGDGHITLDARLGARGVAPPVAPQASLSRIGAGIGIIAINESANRFRRAIVRISGHAQRVPR